MVTQTMNDEEKAFEAFRIYPMAKEIYDQCRADVSDRFRRGTKFPYFQRCQFKDDRNNTWTMTFLCKSKADKKHGRFYVMCYTVYEIQKKKGDGTNKYDGNTGKGILVFDPIGLYKRAQEKRDNGMGMIIDIVPHAFNRYTQRYLKPLGKENIEFMRKVESIILRWKHFDVSADIYGDKNAKHHTKDGICPYDVIMAGGGMLRGYIVDEMLMRFTTYVSKDMMFDNQLERQEKMMSEYYQWGNKGLYNKKV